MKILSQIDIQDPSFRENCVLNAECLDDLAGRLVRAKAGGGAAALERLQKQGKLTVHERIVGLVDENAAFLELSALAGEGLYEEYVPSGGIVTGIGLIHGRPCVIVANDPSVKGGTYFPITLKKHLRAQQIAAENHLPCIYLVDSGGAFLPMQDEVFPDREHFGRIFYNQARMSAARIPQISAIHGHCTAGGAYIPAMSDQSVIVKNTGTIYLAGPPLVKAATGEDVSAQELGGAYVHTAISGVTDYMAENDEHALLIVRDIVEHLSPPAKMTIGLKEPAPPAYPPEELAGIMPRDLNKPFEMREVIARIVDRSEFFEFKPAYGCTILTGFAHIEGIPVGIIANNGVLFSESALKVTHFVELCTAQNIPLVFLQNITGFMVGKEYEHGGIAKHGAKMVSAVANANVPKITLIVGGSYGAGNYGMCGRAYDPRYLFLWPSAKIAVMGGEQAAGVLAAVKRDQLARQSIAMSPEEFEEIKRPIRAKYEAASSAYYASARLWDDGVIDPRASRQVLAMALASTLHHHWEPTVNGIFRM